jgi:hypothetical protein
VLAVLRLAFLLRRAFGFGFRLRPPPPAARSFFIVIEDQSPLTSDEQLAAFKAEKGVAPHDHLVVFTFA